MFGDPQTLKTRRQKIQVSLLSPARGQLYFHGQLSLSLYINHRLSPVSRVSSGSFLSPFFFLSLSLTLSLSFFFHFTIKPISQSNHTFDRSMLMGLSENKKKHRRNQAAIEIDSDAAAAIRLIAGIPILKPVYTAVDQSTERSDQECVTPKGEESRIPPVLTCPPAPRKKRKASRKCKCHDVTVVREFFSLPADWETVFTSNSIRNHDLQVQRAL